MTRAERQRRLEEWLREDPLQTDEELAQRLGVSVPTIRLDRLRLGIPDWRGRTQGLARRVVQQRQDGLEPAFTDGEPGRWLSTRWVTEAGEEPRQSPWVTNAELFRQADALVCALIGEVGFAGLAHAKFRRPVRVGEALELYAEVIRRDLRRQVVLVVGRSAGETVFRAKFVVEEGRIAQA